MHKGALSNFGARGTKPSAIDWAPPQIVYIPQFSSLGHLKGVNQEGVHKGALSNFGARGTKPRAIDWAPPK